jgi:hypothetical protein
MSNDTGRISRRTLLRGAGAMMALPFLEAMLPVRAASGPARAKPPVRLGIVTVTGGTVLESWKPKETGPLGKLPSILAPLDFAKKDMLVVSGLAHSGRSEGLNGHEHCAYLHLTGAPLVKKVKGKPMAGVSIDQAAAKALGDQTLFSSLEFGLTSHETMYSWRGPEVSVPYESNPRLVFERMFRGRKPIVPNWHRRHKVQGRVVRQDAKPDSDEQSVLDLVLEDARDLRAKLGRADQRKLDEYLYSVRAIEKRVAFVESRLRIELLDAKDPGPSKPNLPGELPPEGGAYWKFFHAIHRDPEKHAEYIRLMADLLVLAFQTDTTRVATVAIGSDEALFPGVVTVGYERHCHTLEHRGNAGRPEDADPIAREGLRQVHAWYTKLVAEMVAKMQKIDEGGSSLLDNSLLLYTSYMSDGGHGTRDYPVALLGKAGGVLKTGRHLVCKERTPMANLYVETLNLMGVHTEKFGDSHTAETRVHDGRLPGLS